MKGECTIPCCGCGETVGEAVGVGEFDLGCLQSGMIFRLVFDKFCLADNFRPPLARGMAFNGVSSHFSSLQGKRATLLVFRVSWTGLLSGEARRGVGLMTEFLISSNSAAAAVEGIPLPHSWLFLRSPPCDNAGDGCLEDTVRIGGTGGTTWDGAFVAWAVGEGPFEFGVILTLM